ncbi:hypothetical protein [Clostridium isatidis]|nr:hypothetical protein [Clostridium isatidis]
MEWEVWSERQLGVWSVELEVWSLECGERQLGVSSVEFGES